jgi:SAM-dependent methyltransferase
MIEDGLPYSPAADRNRRPIGEVLRRWLPQAGRVLEIGSGSGQHAAWFHALMPALHWQASEVPDRLQPLAERLAAEAPGLPAPIALDVGRAETWPQGGWDAVYTANTLHIMPWAHTGALLVNAARRLQSEGLLIVYGPFHEGGRHDADSNRRFDETLRQRDPAMGVRDAAEIRRLAASSGLEAEADLAMPANNRILIFRKNR